jgi:hypothetical protein
VSEPTKVMYYAPVPDGRSRSEFRSRWREHGKFAMGLPMWRNMTRYVQYPVIGPGEHGVDAGQLEIMSNGKYGGVGAIWFRDDDALRAAVEDPDGSKVLVDEVETFGRELGENLVATREHVILDQGPGAITVMNKLHRVAGVSRESFSEQWLQMGIELGATPELARHIRRYVQSHALPDSPGWDGMVELEFDSAANFFAFMAEPKATEWMFPREESFIDIPRGEPLMMAGEVFYDEAAGPVSSAQRASS